MQIQENISLKPYNSFRIEAGARWFAAFDSVGMLQEVLQATSPAGVPRLVLGGGSNLLFTVDYNGLVLKNEIPGIEKTGEDEDYVYVRAGAGENWHRFVQYCISQGWAGLENLSLIPGCVGASPMQNIGAYGVEISDSFSGLKAFHLAEKTIHSFGPQDCGFGYRESVFKNKYRDQYVILEVSFRLRKRPVFHTEYGAIREELEKMGVQELSIRAIADAVISIRSARLPDPEKIGNAGSFFKNPSVSREFFDGLKQRFPGIVGYPHAEGVKLAAGWLIEQCGWKGYRKGDAGCHDRQALVLVNHGHASGAEIYSLSEEIMASVQERFGVILEREVNIV